MRLLEANWVRGRPSALERVFAVIVLAVATVGTIPPGGTVQPGRSNSISVGVWIVFYAGALWFALPNRGAFLRTMLSDSAALMMVGLALASASWSAEPGLTFRRAAALGGTCVVGWYFAERYTRDEFLATVGAALAIVVFASMVAVVATPFGVSPPEAGLAADPAIGGAWRGIYETKNALAQVMVLGIFVLPLAARMANRGRWLLWVAAATSVTLLIGSRSATGLVIAFAMLGVQLVGILRRRTYELVGLACMALAALAAAAMLGDLSIEGLVSALGRDPTLTGRTQLWSAVIDMVASHPWFGWGHGAFWLDYAGQGSNYIILHIGWLAGYAHNGFLDQALGLGLVGMAVLAWVLVAAWLPATRCWRRTAEPAGVWPAGFMIFLVLANLTEGGIVQQNFYMWLILIAVAGSLRREFGAIPERFQRARRLEHVHTPAQ